MKSDYKKILLDAGFTAEEIEKLNVGFFVEEDYNHCRHVKHIPAFDQDQAANIPSSEVRKRWPRFEGICEDCGKRVIVYASDMHYIRGDY